MYEVSNHYRAVIKEKTRKYRWAGVVTDKAGRRYPFTEKDIVKGSGTYISSCCGSTDLEIGTVYASELDISLFYDIDRYTLYGGTIVLSFFLALEGGGEEEVPLGIFRITEATRRGRIIQLKAYDRMIDFDKTYADLFIGGSAFEWLSKACEACEVPLGVTEDEINALPNSDLSFYLSGDNDISTWRDVIACISKSLCSYCHIDRQGRLVLKQYGMEPVATIPSSFRYSSEFADFETRYTSVSITNSDGSTEYESLEDDDGLTYALGRNTLAEFAVDDIRKEYVRSILTGLSTIRYTPFDIETPGDPALDVGDVLSFGDPISGKVAAITEITYSINGRQKIRCVGKNPRLSDVKTKTDKALESVINKVSEKSDVYYFFVNDKAISIGKDQETLIITLRFATAGKVDVVDVTMEIGPVLEKTGEDDAVVSFRYVLNGTEIDYYPENTYSEDGKHLIGLHYWIQNTQPQTAYTFNVYMKVTGGKALIERGDARGAVHAQGLAASAGWDGNLEASDAVNAVSLDTAEILDDVVVQVFGPVALSPSDLVRGVHLDTKAISDAVMLRHDLMVWTPYVNTPLQTVTDVNIDTSTKKYKNAGTVIIDTINPPTSIQILDNGYPRYYFSFDGGNTWSGYSDLVDEWVEGSAMTGAQVEGIDPSIWDKCLPFKIKVVMDSVSELSQITAVGSTRNTDSTITLSFDEAYVGKEWTVTGGVESYSGRVTAALHDAVTLLAPLTEYSFTCDHRTIAYKTGNFGAAGNITFDVSVLIVSFDEVFEGEDWTVSAGTETYTGTVGNDLTAVVRLQQLETAYEIECGGVTKTVTTGNTGAPMSALIVPLPNILSLYKSSQKEYQTGAETYTATENERVIVLNLEVYSEANGSYVCASTNTTTGNVLGEDNRVYQYNGLSQRASSLRVSIIDLLAGDTITMSNSGRGSYGNQIHLIYKIGNETTPLIDVQNLVADNNKGTLPATYTATEKTFAITLECASNQSSFDAGQSYSENAIIDESYDTTHSALQIGVISTGTTVTMNYGNHTNYVSKGFIAVQIS